MDVQKTLKQQLRWQSLRPFNITIVCSFIFFFLTGIGQSYTIFDSSPIFTTPLFIPLIILLFCLITLHCIINKKDIFAQRIIPTTSIMITLFVVINSHFQEQTQLNNFLYLVLLLPLFYSYLFAYNTAYLVINNILLVVCYVFASLIGNTDALVFLFNSTFLITLCYLTIFTQSRHSNLKEDPVEKKFEKTTVLSQKSGRYLNRIVHDIRQPLSSLSLYSSLLENKLSNTTHLKLVQNIKHSSEELERWIASLLDLARLDGNAITPTISEFPLTSALLPTIKKYQYQASTMGIQLISRIPELAVKSDKRLLTEIVEVLLSNAIVHGSQKKGAYILLSVRHYSDKVLLQVWNQGQAIPDSIFENLFDEVAQADNPLHNRSKGIGLGLAVAQRKAILCDTKIVAISNDHGSRFSLNLESAQHIPKQFDFNKVANHAPHHKILLIDDDQGILSALSMLLENWGYQVDCASTAEEGLQKHNTTQYDLVISDYRLPNQKTGLDIIKVIKRSSNIPAVLLTGEADPGKLKEVQNIGKEINYKVLNKPVKPASLRVLLKQVLK
ncbi:response regulator [Psychromonas sp. RZ22]|uniref:response regulator n=1 Tax=Psychromonas algarum TaxID=2555643 RepID=UPI001067E2D2|nr:response regulator [Psychromonas sp. RZ22]TEW54613.1 response regulator [Psychromonas sp. RZ22]